MIEINNAYAIEKVSQAGKILAKVMEKARAAVKPGIATQELDGLIESTVTQGGGKPAFKGYRGFPASSCISVNEEVVHGIPGRRCLGEGDIVSIDIGIELDGYFADSAITIPVGKIGADQKKLLEVTKKALQVGIKKAQVGSRLSDISWGIQQFVESQGFSVIRDFVGHGIGRAMHQEPQVPNFGQPRQGPILRDGMILAIEPMVSMGTWQVEILDNGWTAVTKDRKLSAHFEHTIVLTTGGPRILTA